MNSKTLLKKSLVILLTFGFVSLAWSQSVNLGLEGVGGGILKQLEKFFPYVVGISFIFTGWKALEQYNESGKDIMVLIKYVAWFVVGVLVIVAMYKGVKNIAL